MQPRRSNPPLEAAILRLARCQHGVVAHRQLRELGLGAEAIKWRLRNGRLVALYRGVYALGHDRLTPPGRRCAAVLACGPGAVLSHGSAAEHWGLRRSSRGRLDVTVARNGPSGHAGVRVHRTRALPPHHATVEDGVPVTSVARTLIDLAEVSGRQAVERAIREAEILRLFDLSAVARTIEECPGRIGAARLGAALDLDGARAETNEGLEDAFLVLCDSHELPRPLPQQAVGPYVVDFLWPRERLVVETDDRASHLTASRFESDRARDAELTLAGYTVLRVTWRQVTREPSRVAGRVGRAIAHRAAPPGGH